MIYTLFNLRLLNAKETEWGSKVVVVSSDMRSWQAPEKVCDV